MADKSGGVVTIQSNINSHTYDDLTKYALFAGGLNVTHEALAQYDPLTTGYGRIFMVRKPIFLNELIPTKLNKYKHILEYGNIGVAGISNTEVDFETITGGYNGKSFEIPVNAKDNTTRLTIKTYEFSGSPVREVQHMWITGVIDMQSGLGHYHDVDLPILQANHTAEFIYLVTDRSGKNIEYACQLSNCFPTDIKVDHFNYDAGTHAVVPMDVEFTCTKYESPQINSVASQLLEKYNILRNHLNFDGGITANDLPASTLVDIGYEN